MSHHVFFALYTFCVANRKIVVLQADLMIWNHPRKTQAIQAFCVIDLEFATIGEAQKGREVRRETVSKCYETFLNVTDWLSKTLQL